jgi:hypothetical protein
MEHRFRITVLAMWERERDSYERREIRIGGRRRQGNGSKTKNNENDII